MAGNFGKDFLRGAATFLNPAGVASLDRNTARQGLALQKQTDIDRQLLLDQQNQRLGLIKDGLINPADVNEFGNSLLPQFSREIKTPFQAETFPGEPQLGGVFDAENRSFLQSPKLSKSKNSSKLGKLQRELEVSQLALDRNPENKRAAKRITETQEGIRREIIGTKLFESTLDKKVAEQIVDSFGKAEKSIQSINSANEAVKIINDGINTGFFSNVKTAAASVAKDLGFNVGDELQNTQKFLSVMGRATLGILGSGDVGAGTGISDNDVKFVKQVVAGDATLDEKTIKDMLTINAKINKELIRRHNSNFKRIKNPSVNLILDIPDFVGFGGKKQIPINTDVGNQQIQTPPSGIVEVEQGGNIFDKNTGKFIRKAP